jgi:hypothetical protein
MEQNIKTHNEIIMIMGNYWMGKGKGGAGSRIVGVWWGIFRDMVRE